MPPEKKFTSTCKHVILQRYTVKATTSQSITTLQVDITLSQAFSFFHLSLISDQCLSKIHKQSFAHVTCVQVLKFLLQGFAGSSHSFGWLLTPGFQCYSCLASFAITFMPLLVYLTAINSLQRGKPIL